MKLLVKKNKNLKKRDGDERKKENRKRRKQETDGTQARDTDREYLEKNVYRKVAAYIRRLDLDLYVEAGY